MRLVLCSFIIALGACAEQAPPEKTGHETAPAGEASAGRSAPTLDQLWVASGFSAPEGVAPAPAGGYFISNVAGEGAVKDGEGWVSILSEDGAVLDERFIEGLDAPKGMVVLNGRLYVADIDRVRIYDAQTGAPEGVVTIEGAQFLNDATTWRGAVFISDSANSRIHRVVDGAAETWLEDERLGGVNGLLGDGDTLLISTMTSGSLFRADSNGTLTEIANGMTNADGIGIVPGGGWMVSSWPGEIHYVSPTGETTTLLDTQEEEILQNDLTMFGEIVIVPNWRPGTVTAWRVVR